MVQLSSACSAPALSSKACDTLSCACTWAVCLLHCSQSVAQWRVCEMLSSGLTPGWTNEMDLSPVHPPSVLLTSDTKCTLWDSVCGKCFFFGRWSAPLLSPLSFYIVHSCLNILYATLYDAYFFFFFFFCFAVYFGWSVEYVWAYTGVTSCVMNDKRLCASEWRAFKWTIILEEIVFKEYFSMPIIFSCIYIVFTFSNIQ